MWTHLSPPLSHILLIWGCACGSHHSVDSDITRPVPLAGFTKSKVNTLRVLLNIHFWHRQTQLQKQDCPCHEFKKASTEKCCLNIVISPVDTCYTLELIPRVSKNEAFFLPWGIAYACMAKCTATWLVVVQGHCGRSGLLGKALKLHILLASWPGLWALLQS